MIKGRTRSHEQYHPEQREDGRLTDRLIPGCPMNLPFFHRPFVFGVQCPTQGEIGGCEECTITTTVVVVMVGGWWQCSGMAATASSLSSRGTRGSICGGNGNLIIVFVIVFDTPIPRDCIVFVTTRPVSYLLLLLLLLWVGGGGGKGSLCCSVVVVITGVISLHIHISFIIIIITTITPKRIGRTCLLYTSPSPRDS